jgi:hypothetical protein
VAHGSVAVQTGRCSKVVDPPCAPHIGWGAPPCAVREQGQRAICKPANAPTERRGMHEKQNQMACRGSTSPPGSWPSPTGAPHHHLEVGNHSGYTVPQTEEPGFKDFGYKKWQIEDPCFADFGSYCAAPSHGAQQSPPGTWHSSNSKPPSTWQTINSKTRLCSTSPPFQPQPHLPEPRLPEPRVPEPRLPEPRVPAGGGFAGVVDCVRASLADAGAIIKCIEATEGARGWTVTGYVEPKSLKAHRSQLFEQAKQALLRGAEHSEKVFVLGFASSPFTPMPLGFGAALVEVHDPVAACWGSIAQGFCENPSTCRLDHPRHRVGVHVVLKPARKCAGNR